MRSETLHAILPLAIVAGLAFSALSAAESLDPALRGFCSVSPFFSCAKVDQSGLTSTFGIPDYLIGLGGFALMFVLDIQVYRLGRGIWLDVLTFFSGLGFAFSAYFAWVELAQIQAFCLVCFASYVCNGVVLVTALWLRHPSTGSGRSARPTPSTEDG